MTSTLQRFALAAAAFSALTLATPALAVSSVELDNSACSLVTGCKFSGNIAPNTVQDTQDAYNFAKNPDITLKYLGKSDSGFGTVTGGPSGMGTWTVTGYNIDYYAVKAGNNFILYSVLPGVSSLSYTTDGLQMGNSKNLPGLSHIAFFGSLATGAVPEPASWAMMIGGFGMMGAATRRRQRTAITFA